jgi:hypothetical protein
MRLEGIEPEALANMLVAQAAEIFDEDYADLYLANVVAELFELNPGLREHISDLILVKVSEELYRRGAPGRDAARMVAVIQREWSQEI